MPPLTSQRPAAFAALVLLATACTSGSGNAVGDGEAPADGASMDSAGKDAGGVADAQGDAETCRIIRLDNTLCTPTPLPTSNGMTDCHMLLAYVDGGCAQPGLTTASDADVSCIDALLQANSQPPFQGTLCVLAQVSPGQEQNGWCQDDPSPGWCYVMGSCVPDAGCAQDICATVGFSGGTIMHQGVVLACP